MASPNPIILLGPDVLSRREALAKHKKALLPGAGEDVEMNVRTVWGHELQVQDIMDSLLTTSMFGDARVPGLFRTLRPPGAGPGSLDPRLI